MKGFILAAGFGKRLRPLTEKTPKPLLPVAGVPAVCFAVTLLKEAGISEVVVNCHYRHRDITDFFTKHRNFGLTVHFSVEEEAILGTGGGIKRCERILGGDFVLANSDVISDLAIRYMVEDFYRGGGRSLLALCPNGMLQHRGPVSVQGSLVADFNGIMNTGIPPTHEYTGIAVLNREIFPLLEKEPSSVVTTGYRSLVEEGRLRYAEHHGLWADIGTIDSYTQGSRLVRGNRDLEERVCRQTGFRFSDTL